MISSLVLLAVVAWTDAKPDYPWSFPADHWSHPGYKTEWWYFTGQLRDGDTQRFAYQFTFFKVGLHEDAKADSAWSSETLIMGHLAITDLTTGEHRFSEVIQRLTPFMGGFGALDDPRIAWCRAPAGTKGLWELRWDGKGFWFSARDSRQKFGLILGTREAKPLVFQGPQGVSRKGSDPNAASLYYSETRLTTRGEVELDGKRYEVSGESWMDKEFGSNLLSGGQVGWDWLSLQLDDGRELMLYVLRNEGGGIDWASGTLVARDGTPTYLTRDDFLITASGTWKSPQSAAAYPMHWRVEVPGQRLTLDVDPLAPAQENVSQLVPKLFYWEGAVRVSGSVSGRGFVELTGYSTSLKPAL